jgi:hypothetical protein
MIGKKLQMVAILLALTLAACEADGERQTGGRGDMSPTAEAVVGNVGAFDTIEIDVPGQVVIEQGETVDVRVEAGDEAVASRVVAEERTRSLIVTGENLSATDQITVHIVVDDVRHISLSGAAELTVDRLEVSSLTLVLRGAGEMRFGDLFVDSLLISAAGTGEMQISTLSAESLEVDISGSGDVHVSGTVEEQAVSITGNGSYHALGLESRIADVTVAGNGDALLHVSDELTAGVAGSGSIEYAGSPTVTEDISGAGTVRRHQR